MIILYIIKQIKAIIIKGNILLSENIEIITNQIKVIIPVPIITFEVTLAEYVIVFHTFFSLLNNFFNIFTHQIKTCPIIEELKKVLAFILFISVCNTTAETIYTSRYVVMPNDNIALVILSYCERMINGSTIKNTATIRIISNGILSKSFNSIVFSSFLCPIVINKYIISNIVTAELIGKIIYAFCEIGSIAFKNSVASCLSSS